MILISTLLVVLLSAILLLLVVILADRKILASVQGREGPSVVGIFGLFQTAVDGFKVFLKTQIPGRVAFKAAFVGWPIIIFFVGLLNWVFVPVTSTTGVVDFMYDLLVIYFLMGLDIVLLTTAAWSTVSSKFTSLGAIRETIQMCAYELIVGFSLLVVILHTGSLSLRDCVEGQISVWFVYMITPYAFLFYVVILAELHRTPFDLAESESELTAGYQTEHGGSSFSTFYLAEYNGLFIFSIFFILLFFGGWYLPFGFKSDIAGTCKISMTVLSCLVVRAALPRTRVAAFLSAGWSLLLPLATNLIVFYTWFAFIFSAVLAALMSKSEYWSVTLLYIAYVIGLSIWIITLPFTEVLARFDRNIASIDQETNFHEKPEYTDLHQKMFEQRRAPFGDDPYGVMFNPARDGNVTMFPDEAVRFPYDFASSAYLFYLALRSVANTRVFIPTYKLGHSMGLDAAKRTNPQLNTIEQDRPYNSSLDTELRGTAEDNFNIEGRHLLAHALYGSNAVQNKELFTSFVNGVASELLGLTLGQNRASFRKTTLRAFEPSWLVFWQRVLETWYVVNRETAQAYNWRIESIDGTPRRAIRSAFLRGVPLDRAIAFDIQQNRTQNIFSDPVALGLVESDKFQNVFSRLTGVISDPFLREAAQSELERLRTLFSFLPVRVETYPRSLMLLDRLMVFRLKSVLSGVAARMRSDVIPVSGVSGHAETLFELEKKFLAAYVGYLRVSLASRSFPPLLSWVDWLNTPRRERPPVVPRTWVQDNRAGIERDWPSLQRYIKEVAAKMTSPFERPLAGNLWGGVPFSSRFIHKLLPVEHSLAGDYRRSLEMMAADAFDLSSTALEERFTMNILLKDVPSDEKDRLLRALGDEKAAERKRLMKTIWWLTADGTHTTRMDVWTGGRFSIVSPTARAPEEVLRVTRWMTGIDSVDQPVMEGVGKRGADRT